jgi:uncharacterized membrane protein
VNWIPLWGFASGDVVSVNSAAGPGIVVMLPGVVPVRAEPSVAVTDTAVPATVLGVNVTVAVPEPVVVDVALPNRPPAPPLHVTISPPAPTALLFASTSCAVIVVEPPAATEDALDETRYFVAAPGVEVIGVLVVPEIAALSSAVIEYDLVVATVVKVTVASPDAFVGVETPNDPPFELDQLIVRPAIATLLPLASFSCALIVTGVPATGAVFDALTA